MRDDGAGFYKGMTWVLAAYIVAFVAGILVGHVVPIDDPLWIGLVANLTATVVIFGFSFLLGNSSVYDPYWSVAPIALVAYWRFFGGDDGNPLRQLLVVGLVAFWGARLTSNWTMGWSGLEHEDWRYVRIRQQTRWLYWPVSFLGIHLFPTLIVFLALWPAYVAVTAPGAWNWAVDVAAAATCIGATLIEAVSDAQLRAFRQRARRPEAVIDEGFWRWTRHPNYLGEILFWWGLWLFAVATSPKWAVTGAGALAIALMFRFISIPMMERRMLERRPAYAAVIARVPMLLPWPPGRRTAAADVDPDVGPPTANDRLVDERSRLMLDTMPFVPPPDEEDDEPASGGHVR